MNRIALAARKRYVQSLISAELWFVKHRIIMGHTITEAELIDHKPGKMVGWLWRCVQCGDRRITWKP